MPITKLTLSVDEALVQRAREYSQAHETSISRLVSSFFERLPSGEARYTPRVRRLMGLLSPEDADVEHYHRYLEEKYGS